MDEWTDSRFARGACDRRVAPRGGIPRVRRCRQRAWAGPGRDDRTAEELAAATRGGGLDCRTRPGTRSSARSPRPGACWRISAWRPSSMRWPGRPATNRSSTPRSLRRPVSPAAGPLIPERGVIGPALHSNHGGGTAYCCKATPERRAAVTRPGMNAHTASQPDTTNVGTPAYPEGPEPENQAPGRCLTEGSAPLPLASAAGGVTAPPPARPWCPSPEAHPTPPTVWPGPVAVSRPATRRCPR